MSNGHGSNRCCRLPTGSGAGRSAITARLLRESCTGTGAGLRGAICRQRLGRGKPCGSATGGSVGMGLGTASTPFCWLKQTRPAESTGRCRWTQQLTVPTSTRPTSPVPQGDAGNYRKLFEEPDDHAVGRSRGGLSTKIHHTCDGKGRPLAFIIGPGQGSDSRMFPVVLDAISVPRAGSGRARNRPDAVLGDKAYSSRANRNLLRMKRIKAVIPEPRDQIANRKRKGSRGGRPVDFDTEAYKGRAVVEQSFNLFKQWRGIATRYDKLALTYRAGVALYACLIWLRQ
jgi:transposase